MRAIRSCCSAREDWLFTVPNDTITLNIAGIPEPSTWAMLALGLAGLGFVRHRASRKARAGDA